MWLASLGLDIGIFCDFLDSVLLLNAILGLDFLGLALSRPQPHAREEAHRVIFRDRIPGNALHKTTPQAERQLQTPWGKRSWRAEVGIVADGRDNGAKVRHRTPLYPGAHLQPPTPVPAPVDTVPLGQNAASTWPATNLGPSSATPRSATPRNRPGAHCWAPGKAAFDRWNIAKLSRRVHPVAS
jgi:hypothetical protein